MGRAHKRGGRRSVHQIGRNVRKARIFPDFAPRNVSVRYCYTLVQGFLLLLGGDARTRLTDHALQSGSGDLTNQPGSSVSGQGAPSAGGKMIYTKPAFTKLVPGTPAHEAARRAFAERRALAERRTEGPAGNAEAFPARVNSRGFASRLR